MCQSKLPTILVVDDEASARVFLKEALMAEGYDVSAADSGALALAFAAASPPELILLDVRMPGMDGLEVCRKLKADVGTRNIPVIFLSASDQLEERVQGLRIGAVDFVTKPVKPEELLARVGIHVELGRFRNSLETMVAQRTAELLESESRFRIMADHAPVMIWATGPDGRRQFVSKRWLEFTGRSEGGELLDTWAAVHPAQRDECAKAFYSAMDERREFEMEYQLRRADGEYRWVLDQAVPRFSVNAFAGYVGSAIDITDFKRAADRMLSAEKADSLGLMAGGIAHDFGNRLSTILAEADLALSEMSPRSRGRDNIERIARVATEAVGTVRMLMASAAAGGDPNEAQNLSISAIVEQVFAMAKYSVPKNVTLCLNLEKQLKPVRCNLLEIRQVIMNLLLNSIEALGDKEGKITISTEHCYPERDEAEADTLPEGEYVRLRITDTGYGISADIRRRIFDQFFTTKPGGRGLGLSVVHGIVRSHNGVVRVASPPGEGATLEVLLPCAKSAEAC